MQDDIFTKKLRVGDTEAFAQMMDTYNKLLWAVAGGIFNGIGTIQDIEECISDVYVQLWKNPNAYDPGKGTLKTFLSIMTKTKALDKYRKLSKSKAVEIDDEMPASSTDLPDYMAEKEIYEALYAAIDTISEPNREIIIRRYFFGEKPSRISEKTSIPVKEIENRLYQSKLKLRKILNIEEVYLYGER